MVLPALIDAVGKALITNDLFQAGKQALTKYSYEAVVKELATRIGGREYDGYPGRPSYRSAGGQVSMWASGKAMSARPDHTMTLIDLVKRELLDPGVQAHPPSTPKPPTRPPSKETRPPTKATGPRAQWGEPIDDAPKKKKEDDPKQLKLF
jgi:hypothetical protein